MLTLTVYHNQQSRFMPYEDGQRLAAVTSHRLEIQDGLDPQHAAEWAFNAFNADLDRLEESRTSAEGEMTFLAACVYRLLGHRSLSVSDVNEIRADREDSQWLACDRFGWRHINEPSNLSGEPLTADNVYQHLRSRQSAR
jgi:hypothetical protein